MKLVRRTMVDLDSNIHPGMLGHISIHEKKNGNLYYTYFVEERFFGAKEVSINNEIIFEYRAVDEYHYSIDSNFNNERRWLGWK